VVSERLSCPLCRSPLDHVTTFDAPPPGETDFGFEPYHRELWACRRCGHVVNRHGFPLKGFYGGAYAATTYGARMAETFARIMALPPERSDNRQRVARINAFADAAGIAAPRDALDVGAGLGVFPAALQASGWRCVAVEPDPRAARHIEAVAGVPVKVGDFLSIEPEPAFDLVSFNKVLEHIVPMIDVLARARAWLKPAGIVYVELPDGEAALTDGVGREEFFVEHHCAFGLASFALLANQAGFQAQRIERIREPSGKYTLFGFLTGR